MTNFRGLAMVLAIIVCAPALAVLPPDACIPPAPLPDGPTAQAVASVSFTAYSEIPQSSTPFTVQFWREPCPGEPGKSLLYLRPIPGFGAFVCAGFRIIQNGVQYDPQETERLGGPFLTCGNLSVPKTYLLEQDSRNPLFLNSGAVTLLHLGSVSSSASLPAYTGTGGTLNPQIGLWWNPNESGSGYNIDVKHNVIVITVFSYKSNGDTEWYIASGALSADGRTFSGTLDKYRGGQCIACGYTGRPNLVGNDGFIGITFTSSTSAVLQLPGGRVTNIQPQEF